MEDTLLGYRPLSHFVVPKYPDKFGCLLLHFFLCIHCFYFAPLIHKSWSSQSIESKLSILHLLIKRHCLNVQNKMKFLGLLHLGKRTIGGTLLKDAADIVGMCIKAAFR